MAAERRRIYLATGNAHKVAEFQRLADASGVAVELVRPAALPVVVEDTGTFLGNARKKARALQAQLPPGTWVLADDSGVCVAALDGAPGVESAYFAGPQGDAAANLRKLTEVMRDVPAGKRGAHFLCLLILLGPNGEERVFEGRCEGRLRREPAGGNGFGYDPLFQPAGHDCTYAELDDAAKNKISHRGRAWLMLAEWLRTATVDEV
jgi:XTP/dITP diphosphohydrolase